MNLTFTIELQTGVNPVKIVVGLKCDMETKRQVKFTDALDASIKLV